MHATHEAETSSISRLTAILVLHRLPSCTICTLLAWTTSEKDSAEMWLVSSVPLARQSALEANHATPASVVSMNVYTRMRGKLVYINFSQSSYTFLRISKLYNQQKIIKELEQLRVDVAVLKNQMRASNDITTNDSTKPSDGSETNDGSGTNDGSATTDSSATTDCGSKIGDTAWALHTRRMHVRRLWLLVEMQGFKTLMVIDVEMPMRLGLQDKTHLLPALQALSTLALDNPQEEELKEVMSRLVSWVATVFRSMDEGALKWRLGYWARLGSYIFLQSMECVLLEGVRGPWWIVTSDNGQQRAVVDADLVGCPRKTL